MGPMAWEISENLFNSSGKTFSATDHVWFHKRKKKYLIFFSIKIFLTYFNVIKKHLAYNYFKNWY